MLGPTPSASFSTGETRFLVDKFSHVRFEPSGFTGTRTPDRQSNRGGVFAGWH